MKTLLGTAFGAYLWVTWGNRTQLRLHSAMLYHPGFVTKLAHQTWPWVSSEWGGILSSGNKRHNLLPLRVKTKKALALKLSPDIFWTKALSWEYICIICCGDYLEEWVSMFAEDLACLFHFISLVIWRQFGPSNKSTKFNVRCFKLNFLFLTLATYVVLDKSLTLGDKKCVLGYCAQMRWWELQNFNNQNNHYHNFFFWLSVHSVLNWAKYFIIIFSFQVPKKQFKLRNWSSER